MNHPRWSDHDFFMNGYTGPMQYAYYNTEHEKNFKCCQCGKQTIPPDDHFAKKSKQHEDKFFCKDDCVEMYEIENEVIEE